VPLDNNASERSLRRVALGRKNYLFVGDVEAGASIAGLYKRRLDELLPGPWARSHGPA